MHRSNSAPTHPTMLDSLYFVVYPLAPDASGIPARQLEIDVNNYQHLDMHHYLRLRLSIFQ